MEKQIQLVLDDDYRIIALSDIHGHKDIFNDLMKSLQLRDEDYLIIIGDFINKGPENLETLRAMMTLSHRPRTYILKGNHESLVTHYVDMKDKFRDMHDFLKQDPYTLALHDMAKEMSYDLYGSQDSEAFRLTLLECFSNELEFMRNRPIFVETDDFIFVHGGYEKSFDVEKDENKFLKYDFFDK
ncbi:MAG: metallophosphoesterase [Clostridia bacterium]|nr:metallophosphoesterase [Clostridia bacterium]